MASSRKHHVFRDDRPPPSRTAAERLQAKQVHALTALRLLRRDRAFEEVAEVQLRHAACEKRLIEAGQAIVAAQAELRVRHGEIDVIVRAGATELRVIHRMNDAAERARFDVERFYRQQDRLAMMLERIGQELESQKAAAHSCALDYERISECKTS
ncbi:hypothetical protein ACSFA3_04030 [Variovorax sp. RHLX14]|uniref:hypothetical protein n=1 Tax=Variovorax sp. RHLX14 TaxID=1259731 RepID=UPI003F450FF5